MATVTVGHHPELTAEQAMEVFNRHFSSKYDVYMTRIPRRDFVVKKSGWTGVGVALKQKQDATTFVFTPFMPSFLYQMLAGGLISYVFLRPSWKELEEDVASFIGNAPEFK